MKGKLVLNEISENNSIKIRSFANCPNPFNPQTQIEFSLAEASQVSLVIYNLLGQRVLTLLDETLPAGKHVTFWNDEDESGQKVASGIYFYRLQTSEFNEVRKMVWMK